jgi:uncharacterized BrkB/YihY/UPF0761 family membrane protein
MLWLYIVAIAILVGAEINAELLKLRGHYVPGQRHLAPGPLLPSVAISMPSFARSCALEAQQERDTDRHMDSPVAEDLAAKDGLNTP